MISVLVILFSKQCVYILSTVESLLDASPASKMNSDVSKPFFSSDSFTLCAYSGATFVSLTITALKAFVSGLIYSPALSSISCQISIS